MHSIALNVNNSAYEHLIYFLSNLKDDVEVIKDEMIINSSDIEDKNFRNELLSREKDLKNSKASILTRNEIFEDL